MKLTPVDGNPFGEDDPAAPAKRLTLVEGNPFAAAQSEQFARGPAGVAADTNPLQALMIGAGRGFSQLGAGAQQAAYGLGSMLGIPGADQRQAELAKSQAEADRIYKPMQQAHPLASGIGETLPAFAVPVGGAASVLGAAGRMAIPGAAQALLSYGSPEERLKEAAVQGAGGAIGGGVTAAIGKAISPAVGAAARAADPALERLAGIAKNVGIGLTPAQLGGGKVAQGVEAGLQTIPWTMGAQQAVKDAQQAAYGKSVLSLGIGENASKATPDVLARAADTIGQKFEAGYAGVTVPLNNSTMRVVDSVATKYAARLDAMQKPIVENIANDLKGAGAAGGFLTGEQYHAVVSDITTAARTITDSKTKSALLGLRGALDSSFRAAAPAAQAEQYFTARGQWKNLLTIEDAVKKGRSVSGDIPAKQLYASMQQFNPKFVRGAGGELGDVARMGRQFLPDPTPNSGTALRSLMANALSAGTLGGGGALAGLMTGGDPVKGMELGLLGFGVSKGAQRLYNSGYPTNQLLSEELKRLLTKGGGLLGTGAAAAATGPQ